MFVNYHFAKDTDLPQISNGLYEYVIGSNGVFVRAKRPGLEATIWTAAVNQPIRGLKELKPYLRINKVPAYLTARMVEMAYRANGIEILFYLGLEGEKWRLNVPDQVQSGAAVIAKDSFSWKDTLIEVHSHHNMKSFFSKTDDQEESAGFRIYSVIGNLGSRPTILTRVGIYGHFQKIPSSWVYDLPAGLVDGLWEK